MSKPHASQSHGSGANANLRRDYIELFLDFRDVTEYAVKSANLYFGYVTIKNGCIRIRGGGE